MRMLFRLLLVALVLHGAYRIGVAYWQHYAFEDAVREAVQFAPATSPDAISAQVLELATTMNVPLDPGAIRVSRQGTRILVAGSYLRPVEVLPRVPRDWRFTIDVSVVRMASVSGERLPGL